jgi:hypothetical protein
MSVIVAQGQLKRYWEWQKQKKEGKYLGNYINFFSQKSDILLKTRGLI